MPQKALLIRDGNSAQDQITSFYQLMDIVSLSDSHSCSLLYFYKIMRSFFFTHRTRISSWQKQFSPSAWTGSGLSTWITASRQR